MEDKENYMLSEIEEMFKAYIGFRHAHKGAREAENSLSEILDLFPEKEGHKDRSDYIGRSQRELERAQEKLFAEREKCKKKIPGDLAKSLHIFSDSIRFF